VFDDLVGDPHAFEKSHSAINNLTIRHRHLQCNLLFTTQYITAIPPVLRRNLDIFVILKFANVQSVEEQIYPEISGVIKDEDFKIVFEYATIYEQYKIDQDITFCMYKTMPSHAFAFKVDHPEWREADTNKMHHMNN
jgi:hypothetical protein